MRQSALETTSLILFPLDLYFALNTKELTSYLFLSIGMFLPIDLALSKIWAMTGNKALLDTTLPKNLVFMRKKSTST